MNTFKRKSLYVALAGVSALGATTAAQAVNINPDGLGQVLLYPYYTVRSDSHGNGFVTGLDVVNTTASVKAVKVRFLEGRNSQEVLDFNLYLSPNDVWTAALVSNSTGATIITFDNSCTVPPIPKPSGQPFVNAAYSGDPAGGSNDRTREGYFELIEMGPVTNVTVANAATHNSAGNPANCAIVQNDSNNPAVSAPTGGLFGGETLINVAAGTDYTADPVALDNFSIIGLWQPPGSILPNLSNVNPTQSTVFQSNSAAFVVTTGSGTGWGGSPVSVNADAVSAVLMHNNIFNEYVLDTSTASGTDWVITFPTKRFYYFPITSSVGVVNNLFQRNFVSTGACDDISINIFDREEKSTIVQSFSPPTSLTLALCWEANILTFNNSDVLGSVDISNVPTSNQDGWLEVNFPPSANSFGTVITTNHMLMSSGPPTVVTALGGISTTNTSATYFGLPAIGFSVNSYLTGTLVVNGQTVLSAYGGNFINKASRKIQSP